MCQTYSTKEKVRFIYFPSFEYRMIFIITSHKSISLIFLMKKYFWTPYQPIKFKSTCSLLVLFQFCIQLNTNPMENTMVSKWNLSKNWIYVLMFSWELSFFQLDFFCQLFLYKIPHFHPNVAINVWIIVNLPTTCFSFLVHECLSCWWMPRWCDISNFYMQMQMIFCG